MADTKITGLLSPQVTTNPATDVLPIVNIADTLMASSGSTRKITVNQLLGAGGTATLASATISGDLTVDTNTLYVKSSTNQVGIGTTSPNVNFTLDLTSSNDARARQWFADVAFVGTGDLSTGFQIRTLGTGTNGLKIANSGNTVEWLRIDSTGVHTWENVGGVAGTAMTLNSTGLGVGLVPSGGAKLAIRDSGSNDSYIGLGANNDIYLSTGAAGIHYFRKGSAAASMMIDASGNVGVGVTPSASTIRTIQSQYGAIVGSDELNVTSNAYFGGSWKYVSAATAARYSQAAGVHYWFTAAAGAAANDPVTSFTAATAKMTLDANGNLILLSSATPATLATNGQLTVNATSNTNLRFSYRGSDGTTRVANITLA